MFFAENRESIYSVKNWLNLNNYVAADCGYLNRNRFIGDVAPWKTKEIKCINHTPLYINVVSKSLRIKKKVSPKLKKEY